MEENYAVICLNGHVILSYLEPGSPFDPHCTKCGEKTLNKCPSCEHFIPGGGDILWTGGAPIDPPHYCHNCGKPYPWTERTTFAAAEIIRMSDSLTEEEQSDFISAIPTLYTETPQTKVGILKFKKYAAKAGSVIGDGLRDILVDIISESIKKALWGQ